MMGLGKQSAPESTPSADAKRIEEFEVEINNTMRGGKSIRSDLDKARTMLHQVDRQIADAECRQDAFARDGKERGCNLGALRVNKHRLENVVEELEHQVAGIRSAERSE